MHSQVLRRFRQREDGPDRITLGGAAPAQGLGFLREVFIGSSCLSAVLHHVTVMNLGQPWRFWESGLLGGGNPQSEASETENGLNLATWGVVGDEAGKSKFRGEGCLYSSVF